jgi:Zn-finger nucleic acid-binding protein
MATTLGCPRCGGPASPDATSCAFCGTVLAVVACPRCFGKIFGGTRHCPHCGAERERASVDDDAPRACPRCRRPLGSALVGGTPLRECGTCHGVWVDRASFERLCAQRESQAAVLGTATTAPRSAAHARDRGPAYLPCPHCGALMNRVNFARCSGILLDVCAPHGTWFDDQELRAILEFIRAGGLDVSRTREKTELEEERRRLRALQLWDGASGTRTGVAGHGWSEGGRDLGAESVLEIFSAAGDLLDLD